MIRTQGFGLSLQASWHFTRRMRCWRNPTFELSKFDPLSSKPEAGFKGQGYLTDVGFRPTSGLAMRLELFFSHHLVPCRSRYFELNRCYFFRRVKDSDAPVMH